MTTFNICLIVVLVACSAFHLWCSIDFHRKKNRLDIAALEKRPLVSDEMNAILRDGDSLVVRLGKNVDIALAKQVASRAKALSERGITLYPITDIADKPYMLLVGKQPLLEEPASVEQAGSRNRNTP